MSTCYNNVTAKFLNVKDFIVMIYGQPKIYLSQDIVKPSQAESALISSYKPHSSIYIRSLQSFHETWKFSRN
jgi:hypothetical protein